MTLQQTHSALRVFGRLSLECLYLLLKFGDNLIANLIWRKIWHHKAHPTIHQLQVLGTYL